jgi:nitrite reductase/ring-hydroxylating ferredoxin subunit
MSVFKIDPDIRKAKTLSSEFYTDERYFKLSKSKIFARSWQLVGTVDDLDGLRPVNILEGFLDEPILLSKRNGSLRCLSNVCTHRGNILVEEPCKANLIRCGYPGRKRQSDASTIRNLGTIPARVDRSDRAFRRFYFRGVGDYRHRVIRGSAFGFRAGI